MEIVREVTLEEILATAPKIVLRGRETCWWTTNPDDVYLLEQRQDKPNKITKRDPSRSLFHCRGQSLCDPRGCGIVEIPDFACFLSDARRCADDGYFGRHGMRAFLAAYHGCVTMTGAAAWPWSSDRWDDYSEALNRFDAKRMCA